MGARSPVKLCYDWLVTILRNSPTVLQPTAESAPQPLGVEELISCLRQRWRATYDLQLVVRRRRVVPAGDVGFS